jgi:hypothetical protein
MANEYRIKQYFQHTGDDSVLVTFTSTDDAKAKIGLTATHTTTGSPTVTYALADSNQTLVVTYEFASESDQTTWYASMGSTVWYNPPAGTVDYIKVEWLHQDGSVSASTSF